MLSTGKVCRHASSSFPPSLPLCLPACCSPLQRVAIKKIRDVFRDCGDAKRILRELKLLRHLGGHENISWILDIMVGPHVPAATVQGRGPAGAAGAAVPDFRDVYIVTDLMDCDLGKVIESQQKLR